MRLLITALFFLTAASASAGETLRFATHTGPPLSHFLGEVLQNALAPHGLGVEMIEMPGRRVISEVNSGKMDGDPCRVDNFKQISRDDTSNYVKVNEAIVLTRIVMVTGKETRIGAPSWAAANQGKIAFLRGSKRIRKNIQEKNRHPVTRNLYALKLVAQGRIRSAVMFASVADLLLHDNPGLKEQLIIHEKAIMAYNQFPYLHRKHADLIPGLESSLKHLKHTGRFKKIAARHWINPPREE